jgi:hypothetical protein
LVAARAWVRADRSGPVGLVVNDDAGTWLSASAMAGREWTPVGLVGSLAPAATTARLAVFPGDGTAAGTGAILVDDVQLDLDGRAALPNGTAESPARLSGALLTWAADYTDMARLVGSVPGGLAAPRRTLERAWRGAFFLHRSSWGGFGWLMIWPSRPYERAAGLCTAFILAGLAVALVRPGSLLAGADRAACLRVCSVACVLAVIASVVGSMAGWGTDSLPQGRYLLPALAAFALPAVSLADRVWPRWGPLLLAAAFLSVDAGLVARVMLPSFAVP